MSADQFLTLDGRPTVPSSGVTRTRSRKCGASVTTAEHLGQWFPSPVDIDLRPGGRMRFGKFGDGVAATGTVESVEPPHRLAFTWGADRLTFDLSPDGDGTNFALTHSFDERSGAASFATGWELCLVGLRAVLAGDPLPPADRGYRPPRGAGSRVRSRRARSHGFRCGLDGASGTRQLTCPATVAWDLWFAKDRDTGEQRAAPAVGEPLTPDMAPDKIIGTMTEVDPHHVFAFDVAPTGGPGDHLRLEFADGSGHGTKITLIVTGTDPAERDRRADVGHGRHRTSRSISR